MRPGCSSTRCSTTSIRARSSTGELDPIDLVIVYAAAVIPIVYALLIFPKRDLAAPA